jgi:hypothetical protein
MLGTGVLTSIPGTAILLLTAGWVVVPESADDLQETPVPSALEYASLA